MYSEKNKRFSGFCQYFSGTGCDLLYCSPGAAGNFFIYR